MDRNEVSRWRTLASAAHARRLITAADHDVAMALAYRLGAAGRCDPTRETIATAARCCLRTAARALARLRACGLVEWTRRIVRTREGARQTSSAFRLTLANLATAARRIARGPEGQKGPGPFNRMEKKEEAGERSDLEAARQMAAEATKSLPQITRERLAIVAPPRPTQQEAAESLAERRARVMAEQIAQARAKLQR